MIIRVDELNRIAIDRFTSTSGRWISILAERFERGYRAYYIVIITASTYRVRKVVRIATDSSALAYIRWEEWRAKFAAKPDYTQESELPTGLAELRYSPPFMIEEDSLMLRMRPKGARLFVRDITPIDEFTVRAREAGLELIVSEEHQPSPTLGIIVALGSDPMLTAEGYTVGQIVMFSKYAGTTFKEAGQDYRNLELHEVIGVRDPEDGIEDLMPVVLTTTEIVKGTYDEDPNAPLGAVAEKPPQ